MIRMALLLSMAAAAARGEHLLQELKCPQQARYRVLRDIDGDGIKDLILVGPKRLHVWKGGPAIAARPSGTRAIPEGSALFHVGRWKLPGEQFLFRTAANYLRAGRVVALSGPGLPEQVANILWLSLFTDLDGDGRPDIVDVSLQGYRILFGDATSVLLPPETKEVMDTDVDAASDRLLVRVGFAEWYHGNFNGDKHPDFAIMRAGGLLVYTGDKQGKFDPRRTLEIDLAEARDAALTLRDFNGDGQTDLLAVQAGKGLATLLVADPEKGLRSARRLRLTVPGRVRYTIVSDLDGDGLPDLALPYLPKLSVQDIVRVVARREVMLRVPIFINRGGNRVFPARADSKVNLPVKIRVKVDSVGRLKLGGLIIVQYDGDLDGDGLRDLLVTETSTRLALHRGNGNRSASSVFEKEPSCHFPIPDCAAYDSVRTDAADLNGDGSSDIILHYRGAGRLPDRLFLLLSRKN